MYVCLVAPDRVAVRGPATARAGEEVELQCETSNSNPAATLQWVVDGVAVPATANRHKHTNIEHL